MGNLRVGVSLLVQSLTPLTNIVVETFLYFSESLSQSIKSSGKTFPTFP